MRKKVMLVLGVLLGISGTLCAQQLPSPFDPVHPPENQLFELPYFSVGDAWHFDLGKGNYMELEIADNTQMTRFLNVDSLLLVFLDDMKPFRDSLADPISGKRIDYLVDTAGRKFVRIRETRPRGATFLLGDDQPSLLRTRQDTIYIFLLAPALSKKDDQPIRYNRLTLVINRYDRLEGLVTSGLNSKMREADPAARHRYKADVDGAGYLAIDPTITMKKEGMYGKGGNRNFLELDGLVGVQNYRNLFAPVSGLGWNLVIHHHYDVHTISAHYEGFVLFGTDAQSHQRTYINDFISIGYSFDRLNTTTLKPVGMFTNFSFGWFVHREGGYIPKNSYIYTFCSLRMMDGRFLLEPGGIQQGGNGGPFIRLSYKFL